MGTTLAAVAMTSDASTVVLQVGDSRLYRARAGRLQQVTQDHTVVADLTRAGELSATEAHVHPHRHVLTRAVGVAPDVEMDYAGLACQAGDRLLLCTDGLFKVLADEDLARVLGTGGSPQGAADELVTSALGRGPEDNVTVLVVDVH